MDHKDKTEQKETQVNKRRLIHIGTKRKGTVGGDKELVKLTEINALQLPSDITRGPGCTWREHADLRGRRYAIVPDPLSLTVSRTRAIKRHIYGLLEAALIARVLGALPRNSRDHFQTSSILAKDMRVLTLSTSVGVLGDCRIGPRPI